MNKPISGCLGRKNSDEANVLRRALRKAENDNFRLEDELAEAKLIIRKQMAQINKLEKRLK